MRRKILVTTLAFLIYRYFSYGFLRYLSKYSTGERDRSKEPAYTGAGPGRVPMGWHAQSYRVVIMVLSKHEGDVFRARR